MKKKHWLSAIRAGRTPVVSPPVWLAVLALWLLPCRPSEAAGLGATCAVTWAEGVPWIEVKVTPGEGSAPSGSVAATVSLHTGDGKPVWQGAVPVSFSNAAPWTGKAKMSGTPLGVDAQYRAEVGLNRPDLGLVHAETLVFSGPAKPMLFRALRRSGAFPNETIRLAVRMAGTKAGTLKGATLDWALRDAAENLLAQKQEPIPGAEQPTDCEVEIVPDRRAVGPFKIECTLTSDAGLDLSWAESFAYATALVPVSSMETDDMTEWYQSVFPDPRAFSVGNTPFSANATPTPGPTPARFDDQAAHGAMRSLRLDYPEGQPACVYADVALPGFPIRARVWVKGNGSRDRLVVYWHDRYMPNAGVADYGIPILVTERVVLGTLDFDGWRCFTVPVLGGGMQSVKKSFMSPQGGALMSGDGRPQVPIVLYAFGVEPESPPRDQKPGNAIRTVWIDDLAVETQVPFDRRVTLELRGDTPDRRLHDKAQLVVSIGNGGAAFIKGGRLSLSVKDRDGKTVGEIEETLDIKAGEFAAKSIPLADIARQAAEGPIDIDVLFTDPGSALRVAKRVVFKRANSAALCWDFERPDTFNGGFESAGQTFRPVGGGAEGSALALAVNVSTAQVSVVLHPFLPGITDRIEAQVKGGAAPVDLYPILLDAGSPIVGVPFNKFQLPPIRVDWQGWRKIELAAPAVPANYDDATADFLLKARHPLNLVFAVRPIDGKPVDIRIDNIRVWTHLRPAERLTLDIDYPDDLRIHPPGSPLKIALVNFADVERKIRLKYRLRNLRDVTAPEKEKDVVVPAGGRSTPTLEDALAPGLYELSVEGPDGKKLAGDIMVFDAKAVFGDPPGKALGNFRALEKSLGMMERKAYLDWDNLEKVPGVFTFSFFHNDVGALRAAGYTVLPVLGFAADWAGQANQESLAKGEYTRYIGNHLQTPARLADWRAYAREVIREYKGQFPAWSFWENPDTVDGVTAIAPERYPAMLGELKQWLTMYDPKAKLIAGGFNFDRILPFLDKIPEAHKLPFDMIGIQMGIGDLSPEQADFEGLLAELDVMLKLRETGRRVVVPELDWRVGRYVSLADQAAYHARARLILHALGGAPYQCGLANQYESKEGFGLFYKVPFGNTGNVTGNRPAYVPKPAYFALMQTQRFLAEWKFLKSVRLPDTDLQANRAYVYENGEGRLVTALWRADQGQRSYAFPAGWKGGPVADVFGYPVPEPKAITCTPMPLFVHLPAGYPAAQLIDDLRTLTPTNGAPLVLRELHLAEADSTARARYRRTGATTEARRVGRIAAAGSWDETFVNGIESEQFDFTCPKAGNALLIRYGFADGTAGQTFRVKLNDGPEQAWDLSFPTNEALKKFYPPGIRRSTFVLRGCRAGTNTVALRYEAPGSCSVYRIEPLAADFVDLSHWGLLTAVQSKGDVQKNQSASGTPLTIGKTRYETGLGTHAAALIECPLDGQFARFEVQVGIDGVTDGKGSALFRVLVDGVEKAKTGLMTGFSKAEKVSIDGLEKARRLTLIVEDGGDGQQNDLADWADGKLFLAGGQAAAAPDADK
jgi:hypothetical protein